MLLLLIFIDTLLLVGIICWICHTQGMLNKCSKHTSQTRQYAYMAADNAEKTDKNLLALMRDMASFIGSLKKADVHIAKNHKETMDAINDIITNFNEMAKQINEYVNTLRDEKPKRPRIQVKVDNKPK